MNLITLNVSTVSGVLFPVRDGEQAGKIFVSSGVSTPVIMTGRIQGPQVKGEDGKYHTVSNVYGSLTVRVGEAIKDSVHRYVLDIDGGLRGVLFAAEKRNDKSPDYAGAIDLGDGNEMPLFARKAVSSAGNEFLSLSSMEARPKRSRSARSTNAAAPAGNRAPAPAGQMDDEFDSDIPF